LSEKKPLRILLVDDDEDEYVLLKEYMFDLSRFGRQVTYHLDWVSTYKAGLHALDENRHDVYLVDYRLGEYNGLDLLRQAAARGVTAPVILLTGQGSYDVDMAAMQQGAMDYLVKDQINAPLLERSIRYALDRKATLNELERLVAERTHKLAEANQELRAENALRREAEAVLRESEAKFRTLADTTSAAILIVQDGKIYYANPAAEIITGHARKELLGMQFEDLAHPAYRKALRIGADMGMQVASRFELKILRKSGEERWVDVTGGEIEFEGRPGWVITAFDITERDLAEQALRQAKAGLEARVAERTDELRMANAQLARTVTEAQQRAEELDALYNATSALLSTLDLETLLSKILDSAQNAIASADHVVLYLIHPDPDHQRIHTSTGEHDTRIQNYLFAPEGYVASAIRSRNPLLIRDTQPVEAQGPAVQPPEGARALIITPLLSEEEVLGALALSSNRPGAFSDGDMRLLEGFAATTTAAIQNARLYADVQRLAVTDSLTGQLNRRGFVEMARRELERFQRYGRPLSLILLDIDRFKEINDTYGHLAGDDVLRFVATRCEQNLRQVDLLGRIGGDEFVILLPETDQETAVGVAERIRHAIHAGTFYGGEGFEKVLFSRPPPNLSVSLGVAQALTTGAGLEELIAQADAALYDAKKNGSNRVVVG
jgi:diguanylate cyclase (GGDEF)-like protein/PAS domain S-box-containing protein